jgi:hypothetical protein
MAPGQAAERWEMTERQVQPLCAKGKMKGVVRLGRVWLIPKGAPKPLDERTKAAKTIRRGENGQWLLAI